MSRIKSHSQFLLERDLSQEVDQVILAEMLLEYYNISEGKALDTLKNSVSKALLGPFSRLSVIDTIRKGNLDIQKEIITKEYDLEDEILDLEGKIDELRGKGASRNEIARIRTQIERKNKEFRSFVKMKREQMNKGMKLLEKTIGKNPRRKEYYEAGFIDDKYELAKFEYELAKKKSSDESVVKKLKDDLDATSKKAEAFVSKTKESSKKDASIKDQDLGDLSQIRKNVGTKDLSVVVSLREKSKKKINEIKSQMAKVLSEMKSFMAKSPSYDEVKKSGKISNGIKDLEEKANELDSLENLVSVYGEVISNKGKDLSKESSLTALFSKINNAINDGNDAGSGVTKEVIDLKTDINLKEIGKLLKKLS